MFKKKIATEERLYDILDPNTSFELKEAYNTLCTNVLYPSSGEPSKRLVVTSAVYGEGKTTLAINLASALASNLIDKKVLLIDADLRTPHVYDFMKSKISPVKNAGLSEYLTGKVDSPESFCGGVENLSVIFSGAPNLNPAGLLNSVRMKEFLVKCAEEYDYVIIDTPPANLVSDALLLIGGVDGYIIAAKNKFSKIPALDATQRALNSVGANILGIVLTEIKK